MKIKDDHFRNMACEKHHRSGNYALFVVMLFFGLLGADILRAQEAAVSAQAEPNPVGIDEQLSLIISVTGQGGASHPQIPKIDGLKLMGGPAVSNQYQWVNGQASSSQNIAWLARYLHSRESKTRKP